MQLLRRLSFTMLLMSMMTLVACGGGDISGGSDDDSSEDVITVTLTKTSGELSSENPITVYAVVLDGVTPVADQTVIFSLAIEDSATLDPIAGTATTDSSGVASIDVNVTDVQGSVNVIATYSSASDNISFDSLGDGTPTIEDEEEAASIQLYASTEQLASSGADTVLLTAIAKDIDNNLLEGITISFSSDSGSLQSYVDEDGSSSTVTGADGKVAMLLSTEADASNRDINITAASGDISDSLIVSVMGTTITLTGSSSLAIDDETSYVVNLVDSDGVGISNVTVDVSLSNDASTTIAGITLPSQEIVTNSEGQATLTVVGTSGGTNDIVVSAINATASQEVSVQADSFLFTEFSNGVDTIDPSISVTTPDVGLTQTAELTLTWLRDGSSVKGASVSITTTRGVLSSDSATTDGNGQVTVSLTATDAGKALVTLVGSDTTEDIELTNQLEFEFYAETAATIIAQASPSSIGPDQQTSTITAVVNDENGNLVKNKTVQFVLEDISGGSIYPATAVTDSSGSASTVYTSNSTSAKDGVLITASVDDVEPSTVALTVSDRELFISLGTGNEIEELGTTDYIKEYSVFVTDGDSNSVEGVELTISAIPETYYKGFWIQTYDEDDNFVAWVPIGYDLEALTDCPNEDVNLNGILDTGEDTNGDGELTPGNIVSISGTFVTDEDGRSVIKVNYPQSYGQWLDVKLVVSGKVTGSESSTQTIFKLPVLGDDVTNEDVQPPQQGIKSRGPFGVANECIIPISDDPDSNYSL